MASGARGECLELYRRSSRPDIGSAARLHRSWSSMAGSFRPRSFVYGLGAFVQKQSGIKLKLSGIKLLMMLYLLVANSIKYLAITFEKSYEWYR